MVIFATLLHLTSRFMKDRFVGFQVDFIGFSVSLLCAVHCVGIPFMLGFAPLLSSGFLGTTWIEYGIILFSFLVAFFALIRGYTTCHKKPMALIVAFFGFVLISLGHSVGLEVLEATFTPIGAVIVAAAHIINWKHMRLY